MGSIPSLVIAAACLSAGAAHAVLGERPAASAAASGVAANGGRMQAQAVTGVQVIETRRAGGVIREYVAPSGVVFAVVWSTRLKPRLDELLGRYHAAYADAAGQAGSASAMRRSLELRADDLVVQSGGRMNAFTGRAWVPSLTPAGFDAATLR